MASAIMIPLCLKVFATMSDMSVDGLLCLKPFPLSSLSTIRNLTDDFFFCFSKDYSCLDVCSYLLSTFKYLSRIKRKQDQPFDKMYLKVLTLPFTILHYTYALLYVQNIRFESEIILIIELYNTTSVFLGDTKCY